MLGGVLLALGALAFCSGSYVITTPRRWIPGDKNQLCINIQTDQTTGGALSISMTTPQSRPHQKDTNVTILPRETLSIAAGQSHHCHDIRLPAGNYYRGYLTLSGRLSGASVEETVEVALRNNRNKTFIQTDKYLYQPGQEVKFRLLTVYGWKSLVSREKYSEIWVTSPSQTRIAQWKRVDNSAGLVHLAFQLADEPEEGTYTINVRGSNKVIETRTFKVEDYVLPRFVVEVTPPKYILATDERFTFRACANYTFGQPVKGKMTLEVSNNERRRCLFKYKRTEYVTGCHDFEVTAQELRFMDCSVYSVRATATMEEEGTGVTFNESVRESVRRTVVHLKAVREDAFKKPNLPYFLKVQATLPDDTPAPYVPLEVCYAGRCRNRTTGADGKVSAVVLTGDSQRIIMSTLNCRAQVQTSVFEKTLDHYFSPSNSALQIQVPEETIGCSPGKYRKHLIDILYSANNTQSALLHFQIISRGKVQRWWSRPVDFKPTKLPFDTQQLVETPPQSSQGPIVTGSVRLPITLPPTTSPTVKVLIWYTRDDGEVVSDSVELKRDRCLLHETRLTWSTSREQPGEEVTLSVQAGTDAICSVGVVDKSADLLNPDPDPINLDKIFRYLDNYNIYPWLNSQIDDFTYCQQKVFRQGGVQANSGPGTEDILPPIRRRYYSEYVDSLRMFSDSGLYVFSDLTLETRPCEEDVWDFYDRPYGGGGGPVYDDIPLSVGAPGIVPLSPEGPEFAGREEESSGGRKRPRTRFPETWLWDIVVLPSSGVLSQKVTLPDTITEWVGKAVCANAELGVGLSELESITTFTPFFVDLTLPPSVKRGEVLPVKISIFNYLGQPLPVTVDLLPSPEYEVVEDQTSGGAGSRRKACLAPEDKVVHTIKIRPLAIGDVNITVSAYTDTSQSSPCGSGRPVQREDTLIKPIKVEAEGFLRETTLTKYVCADELSNEPDSAVVWELSPPADIVPDSERGWVTVVGDLLALSLQNLGSLIRLPSGCGEQNMVNFAPNVYMMQYLTVTEQNTPDSTGKLLRFMRTGYQRQLLYRRSNGSYSAFGSADDSGSTWLTAFVLKSFVQAKEFIYIDDSSLNRTRAWLMASELDRSGCVVPVGKVFSKGLKGGLNGKASPVPMTAYVLIALMEAGTSANHPIVTRISQCLLGDTTRDPYTIALKAYALTLAGHPQSTVVLQQLLELAVEDDEGMRWELQRAFHRSNSLAVETAGYAILAMMEQNSEGFILDARKVVKWITTRRNGYGGFYSTQDTVVALQALASYETYAYEGKLDVVATVTAFSFRESERIQQSQQYQQSQQFQVKRSVETANNFVHEFTINEDNKLLQQQVSLPVFPTYVKITMEGQGCSVMQAVLRYNVPEAEPSDAFSLRVDAINAPGRDCDRKRIRACSAYLLPDGESNMAVIEVNLVSGFIPLKDDLKAVVRQNHKVVKRYEVDGSKVSFYIDEFTAEEVCVSFGIQRAVKIEDTKPGSVVVYDYYEPDFAVSQSYTFPYIEECGR